MRMNSLGKRPRFKTKKECLKYAIERIKEDYPDFAPLFDRSFLK